MYIPLLEVALCDTVTNYCCIPTYIAIVVDGCLQLPEYIGAIYILTLSIPHYPASDYIIQNSTKYAFS